MSSGQQMPPWLQEQIGKLQQSQQSLQSIMAQKQQHFRIFDFSAYDICMREDDDEDSEDEDYVVNTADENSLTSGSDTSQTDISLSSDTGSNSQK